MALHYILDGYNIIKAETNARLSRGTLQEQREGLIALLKESGAGGSSRNRVTVVFDGPFDAPFLDNLSSRYYSGEIEVIFSEGETADRKIEEAVLASERPAEVVVVSNDRGIQRLLGGSGASFMSVEEFTPRLFRAPREGRPDGAVVDEGSRQNIDDEFKKKWLK